MDESKHLNGADIEGSKKTPILETDDEKRTRLLSLKIIYFTMFLMTLGFSIILTGIWPYLDKVCNHYQHSWQVLKLTSSWLEFLQLDAGAGKTFMGLIVAGEEFDKELSGKKMFYYLRE